VADCLKVGALDGSNQQIEKVPIEPKDPKAEGGDGAGHPVQAA
jgi:hypothetical protein